MSRGVELTICARELEQIHATRLNQHLHCRRHSDSDAFCLNYSNVSAIRKHFLLLPQFSYQPENLFPKLLDGGAFRADETLSINQFRIFFPPLAWT